MLKTETPGRGLGAGPDRASPTAEEIRQQLRSVLASPVFHGSKRCQQFLEHVCEKALSGEVGALKERMIAIEVFGRQPQTELGEDTIVRVSAREVRKRLAQYYVTPDGAAADVRIDLPPGSYSPEFRHGIAVREDEVRVTASIVAGSWEKRPPGKRLYVALGLVLLLGIAGFGAAELLSASPNMQAFQRFWSPVFRSSEPLLVAVAHPLVYHPSGRAIKLNEDSLPPQEVPLQRALQVPPKALTGADMIPVFNQYVGFGDMVAVTEVSNMLAQRSKHVRIRLASSIEFADMRRAQTFLVGAITNRWTMELQGAWRYRFSWTPGAVTVITDTRSGVGKREWSIPQIDDGSAQEDYVMLCRIRNSLTGGLTLVAAGLKQFGTEAAGRLLADPDQLGAILQKLPAGWETKNMQVVLHAQVVGNTPAQPDVVAWDVW
jgi:hypothetical protein